MKVGKIIKVSGPLVVAKGMDEANIYDVVSVSKDRLIGEIIEMRGDKASIQVYEETTGIGPGDPVYTTGEPLSVELGPGLIETMFDGIQRPLDKKRSVEGDFLAKGSDIKSLDREKLWEFNPVVKVGDKVFQGDIIGTVQETPVVLHKIMVPPGVSGDVTKIKQGKFTVDQDVCTLDNKTNLQLMQKWPVRKGRGYKSKINPTEPLITGQRVIDTFFLLLREGPRLFLVLLDRVKLLYNIN